MPRPALIATAAVAVALGLAGCGDETTRTTAPETVSGSPPAETGGTETAGAETGGAETGGTETGETDTGAAETGAGEELQGDPAAGEELFAANGCGSCHTLDAAGTSGTIGPNLDDAQPPFELVVDRVTNGMGQMPSFSGTLSPEQINDVAAYVVQSTSG
jgi:mono/diheme cytochrome c family protein